MAQPRTTPLSAKRIELNQIPGANAGERQEFAGESRMVLRHRPGVAQFHR